MTQLLIICADNLSMRIDSNPKIERLCHDPASFPKGPLSGTGDEEWLGKVLEAAHPDPTASMEKADFQKKLQEFRSVVDLVHTPPQTPCAKKLGDFVGAQRAVIAELSTEELLDYLKALEEFAFVYNPRTQELLVKDEELFLRLKNTLKVVESLAYLDSSYLKKVNRPEIYRLAILCSPKLTAKGRGRIYRVEKYGMTLKDFLLGEDQSFGLEFLRTYDGSVPLVRHPTWQEMELLSQYAQLHWPEKERLEVSKALALEHQKRWEQTLFEKGVSKRKWRRFLRFSDEDAFKELFKIHMEVALATSPQERVNSAARLCALSWVLSVRKTDQATVIREIVERGHMERLKIFEKAVSPEVLRELAIALQITYQAASTESPLDNYQARTQFIEGVTLALNQQLKKEGDFSEKIYDPLFGGFVSMYITLAAGAGIPLSTEDFLALVGQTEGVTRPVTWEEVRSKGELAVAFDAYPKSSQEDWLENEWEILKRISYQGVPIYDLARQVVDTVIFISAPVEIKELDMHAAGVAHPLFKTIRSIHHDANGNPLPVYERLRIVAHETFHNLEGMGYLKYGLGWLGIVRERDAFFFSAYVLEEYLKLRLRYREEKPISDDEIKQIWARVAGETLAGLTANVFIAFTAPNMDPMDRTVELPQPVYLEILAALQKASPKDRADLEKNILSVYPTPANQDLYLRLLGENIPDSKKAARRAKMSYESWLRGVFFLWEKKRLCGTIPDLQEISAGIFCKGFQ